MEIPSQSKELMIDLEPMARAAHEVNRAYCISLGDLSQKPWDETDQAIKDSAMHGVLFQIMNPEITPEESHATWMAYRVAQGWKFGLTKDVEKKTHPNIVPYSELPKEQRAKDFIFQAVVRQVGAVIRGIRDGHA